MRWPVSAVLRLKALAVHKDHGQSGPDSSVTLVVLALRLAELLVVREADVTIWNIVSREVQLTVVNE